MGSSTAKSDTTAASGPPKFQQPYLEDIFSKAQMLFSTQSPWTYDPQGRSSRVADFTEAERQAQQDILKYTGEGGGARRIAEMSEKALKFALEGALDPNSNPYLSSYAEGAVRPIYQQLDRYVLPETRSQAVQAGAYGSSRQGIAEGLAISDANRQAGDITSKIYSDAYQRGLQTFERGLALAPEVQQLGMNPYVWQAAVGAQQRALEQAKLDDEYMRHYFGQMAPWAQLASYLSLVGGSYGGEGKSTVEYPASWFQKLTGYSLF